MAWFSILPESYSFIETWLVRLFVSSLGRNVLQFQVADFEAQLILGMMAIGPWALLIVYDMILYLFRTATYEIPYIGGRARNRPRPRAPSLSERPSGKPRSFSLTVPGVPTAVEAAEETVEGLKKRLSSTDHNDNITIDED